MANKRETQEEKILRLVESALSKHAYNHASISNCAITGVNFDAKAVSAIETIAEGLVENAKALGSLAMVLQASSIHLETLVKVGK